jgi:prepilin-type N-terminal cleavage/methylation domain-containing protein
MTKINKKFGFTLVELLVVIAIIGVLTTLIMVNFVGSRERANDSQKMQNLNSLKNALRMYYNDNQSYPLDRSTILGIGFTAYMSDLGDTGFTYTRTNNGDGFLLKTTLESGAGVDTGGSQLNCGVAVGSTEAGVYAVCSN